MGLIRSGLLDFAVSSSIQIGKVLTLRSQFSIERISKHSKLFYTISFMNGCKCELTISTDRTIETNDVRVIRVYVKRSMLYMLSAFRHSSAIYSQFS